MTEACQQLAYEQRCQISVLKKRNLSQREVAKSIGASQSIISRELARNTGKSYCHTQAQELSDKRRLNAAAPTKMTPKMKALIDSKLRIEWSRE